MGTFYLGVSLNKRGENKRMETVWTKVTWNIANILHLAASAQCKRAQTFSEDATR